jgi:hypothetical protein
MGLLYAEIEIELVERMLAELKGDRIDGSWSETIKEAEVWLEDLREKGYYEVTPRA